jgi:hypothetical protein
MALLGLGLGGLRSMPRPQAAVAEDSFAEAPKSLTVEQQAKLLLLRREVQGRCARRCAGASGSAPATGGRSPRRIVIDPGDDARACAASSPCLTTS